MSAVVVSGVARFLPAPGELDGHREHVRMNRLSRLALCAVEPALLDAGLGKPLGARTGLLLGSAFGPHATNEAFYRGQRAGQGSARLFAATLPSAPLGDISIALQATGLASAYTPGRHAALVVLDHARRHLAHGRADRIVAIVADQATPLLGELLGQPVVDGAVALVLERAEVCLARGGRARGELLRSTHRFGTDALPMALAAVATDSVGDVEPWLPPSPPTLETGGATALAPALALAAFLLGEGAPTTLVLGASDPAGGAAAAAFRRR